MSPPFIPFVTLIHLAFAVQRFAKIPREVYNYSGIWAQRLTLILTPTVTLTPTLIHNSDIDLAMRGQICITLIDLDTLARRRHHLCCPLHSTQAVLPPGIRVMVRVRIILGSWLVLCSNNGPGLGLALGLY